MMTKPPPYDSAPTLNATQARDARPPAAAVAPANTTEGKAAERGAVGVHASSHDLDAAAGEQDQDEPGAERRRGERAEGEIHGPPHEAVGPGPPPARGNELGTGPDRDRRDRRAGSGSGAPHPEGWRAGEEQRGEREDQHQPRDDERHAADDRAGRAAHSSGAVDRELCRGGSGQQVAGGDPVFELIFGQPPAAVHAEIAQERDVGGWAAEADATDPPPLPQDGP